MKYKINILIVMHKLRIIIFKVFVQKALKSDFF